ncbi:MAG: polyphosphate kinase [Bacteroidia bacterium]|nr:polyphosphate kinase [Bacteroidia bacterium]
MIKLSDFSTRAPENLSKSQIKQKSKEIYKKIGELQYILAAQKKHSILVVFQGMDSSGKDGATRNVFSETNTGGVTVFSFKKPTEEEFAHDFLWRVHKQTPSKGMIKVFNRSHYEDVLIQRVHKWIGEKTVDARIEAINAFEQHLVRDNNTLILKFYLHISKERQREKLQERIDLLRKHWKHNPNDWEERKHWDKYMFCYEDVINRSEIPWHVVPVDQRWYRNYHIAKIVLEHLEKLDLAYPPLED